MRFEVNPNPKGLLILAILNIAFSILFWFRDWRISYTPIHGNLLAAIVTGVSIALVLMLIQPHIMHRKVILEEDHLILPNGEIIRWSDIADVKYVSFRFFRVCTLEINGRTSIQIRPQYLGKGWERIKETWNEYRAKST
ncbi:MAG: hypothetical protein JWM68_4505 [Verrucomicrobiales bacterium]|nr:hypothetical protein [Verrucomicrobiales bacterium]